MSEVKVEIVGVFEQEVAVGGEEQRIPVMLLRDARERVVRVPIGSCEAFAIQLALSQQVVPRPMTHDLALRLLERLSATLTHVIVDSLSAHHVHATIYLQAAEGEVTMDARPGDAVALALRADAPIYAKEDILAADSEAY